MDRLKDKVAIVTGGAQGIGAAIAQRFCAEGACVVIADRHGAAGQALAQALAQQSLGATFHETDVADHAAVGRLIEATVRQYGRLDTLVSNAAVFHYAPIDEASPEQWREVLDVNLSATYSLAHFGVPHLRRQPGASIVIISSVQGLLGFHSYPAYAAAKGGLLSLTRQLAVDLAPQIRVNAISPGTINSHPESMQTDHANDWATRHPLNRLGKPIEVAHAAVFLASDEASFITGHNLVVDGGLTALGK